MNAEFYDKQQIHILGLSAISNNTKREFKLGIGPKSKIHFAFGPPSCFVTQALSVWIPQDTNQNFKYYKVCKKFCKGCFLAVKMSDVLALYQKNILGQQLKVVDPPLSYLNQERASCYEHIFAIEIPYPVLKAAYETLGEVSLKDCKDYNYVDLINKTIPCAWFSLKSKNDRLHERFKDEGKRVKRLFSTVKGRKRKTLFNLKCKVSIRRGEVESVTELKEENITLLRNIEEWRQKYDNLEQEKQELFDGLTNEINNYKEELEEQEEVNKQLADYISKLENEQSCSGKKICEVGKKQARRKIKELKTRIHCALWFCESFGLKIKSINMEDTSGKKQVIEYNDLGEEDKEKIEQVLFLLDKFYIADEFYHELTMVENGLPKSYLIKQARKNLNQLMHIERTPGQYPGAQLNLRDALKQKVEKLLEEDPNCFKNNPIQVKFSGDGSKMTKSTTFILLSFSVLQEEEKVMSCKGNTVVGVVNGDENYETIRHSFSSLFEEINNLISEGKIRVNEQDFDLEIFLGGDYKFLLMVMGLNAANSVYACLWCKIAACDRWDTSKPKSFYESKDMKRTLEDLQTLSSKPKTSNYGCVHPPLIKIELDHIIPDELHLLLRVTDKLLKNLVSEVSEKDALNSEFSSTAKKSEPLHFENKLVKAINDCGVSFSVWRIKNADGSASDIRDFTSLLGKDKKKLLKLLPSKLDGILNHETCSTVKNIWTSFNDLYEILTDFNLEKEDSGKIFKKGCEWIELYCSLRGKRTGYERPRVTPYFHMIAYHIPTFISKYGSLKQFTGQGVEKKNDTAKKIFFHKSNKWDATRDILLTEGRQQMLVKHDRVKNTYSKKKSEYWEAGIKELRAAKRQKMLPETENCPTTSSEQQNVDEDFFNMSVVQLKKLLKQRSQEQNVHIKGIAKMKKDKIIEELKRIV